MRKFFAIVISLVALGVLVFSFQAPLMQILSGPLKEPGPCEQPITYSLGTFDKRFGISEDEFLRVVKIAKETWEKSINKNLFTYAPDGDLKINLVYDARQEASQKLKNIGITVDDTKASYDSLKLKYDAMQADYLKSKSDFESRVSLFKNRQDTYEKEVTYLNANGGASKEDFDRLTNEKNYLNIEVNNINLLQADINSKVGNINALAIVLNRLVSSLNIEVKKFNTIGTSLGGEFEEGTYEEGPLGKSIDIYQFDNEGKLARVLTHEFGHALGLGHLENPKAVMYRLNNGVNEKLTALDIVALRKLCNIPALLLK